MTSLDAAYAYDAPITSRLSESAQRALMALMTLALFEMLLLPNPLLNLITGYAEAGGGNPILKIHFYSYTLFIALAYVVACVGLVRFASEQVMEQPGIVQFAGVVALVTAVTIMRHGIGGVAYMVDTLFAAPLAVMLLFYLDAERRQRLTTWFIWFITVNAVIGIVERIGSVHLFLPVDYDSQFFRATALMGHPLENAFMTSCALFLVPAMPWSSWRKAIVLAIGMAGILAFGARTSFTMSIVLGAAAALLFGGRALMRGNLRLSTLAAAPWIAILSLAAGAALTFGTSLGERVVQLAKFDKSAQARVDVFQLFDYLSTNDLLYGVNLAELHFKMEAFKGVEIVENCWIAILLMLGAYLFVVFVVSLLGFFRALGRGRGAIAGFAILNFLIVASTSNSISTKTPSLVLFSIALMGIPAVTALGRRSKSRPHDGPAWREWTPIGRDSWS